MLLRIKAADSPYCNRPICNGIIAVNNNGISDTVAFSGYLSEDIIFDFHQGNLKTLIRQKQAKVKGMKHKNLRGCENN